MIILLAAILPVLNSDCCQALLFLCSQLSISNIANSGAAGQLFRAQNEVERIVAIGYSCIELSQVCFLSYLNAVSTAIADQQELVIALVKTYPVDVLAILVYGPCAEEIADLEVTFLQGPAELDVEAAIALGYHHLMILFHMVSAAHIGQMIPAAALIEQTISQIEHRLIAIVRNILDIKLLRIDPGGDLDQVGGHFCGKPISHSQIGHQQLLGVVQHAICDAALGRDLAAVRYNAVIAGISHCIDIFKDSGGAKHHIAFKQIAVAGHNRCSKPRCELFIRREALGRPLSVIRRAVVCTCQVTNAYKELTITLIYGHNIHAAKIHKRLIQCADASAQHNRIAGMQIAQGCNILRIYKRRATIVYEHIIELFCAAKGFFKQMVLAAIFHKCCAGGIVWIIRKKCFYNSRIGAVHRAVGYYIKTDLAVYFADEFAGILFEVTCL